MGDYNNVADLLRAKFPEASQRKIAESLGVEHTSVARWFSAKNGGSPTMDSCLRIARACEVDPREVFRLVGAKAAGFEDLFDYYQGRPPSFRDFYLSEPDLATIVDRVERLYRRGQEDEINEALEGLEARWELRRVDFEQLVKNNQADAGCMIIDHSRLDGDVFYTWQCTDRQAEFLAAGEELKGWETYVVEEKTVRIRLYLKAPRNAARDSIMAMLKIWSFGFAQLLK